MPPELPPSANPYEAPVVQADLAGGDEGSGLVREEDRLWVEYEYTIDDAVEFNVILFGGDRRRRGQMWLHWMLAVLIVAGLIWLTGWPLLMVGLPGIFWVAIFIFLLLMMSGGGQQRSRIRRSTRAMLTHPENLVLFGRRRVILAPEGVTEEFPFGRAFRRWQAVQDVVVTERLVLLKLAAIAAVVVPRRAFHADEQIDQFVAAARRFQQAAGAA